MPESSRTIRVAVLKGGPDAEHEVSLRSGGEVAKALRTFGDLEVLEEVIDRPSVEDLRVLGVDVVFPALHGPFGEGGPLQDRLEEAGVPYVGCGPDASRLGMDKLACKRRVAARGVPVLEDDHLIEGVPSRLEPPVVVKPIDDGSSVGVRLCRTAAEFAAARRDLHPRFKRLMAERMIRGREITVGILDGHALPLVEIVPAVEFYDYEAKYLRDDTRYVVEPVLPAGITDACRRHAVAAFEAVGARDLARIDFLVDADGPWFLEVNTMPGMTDHSLLPKAAARVGCSMPALCRLLVDRALARSSSIGAAPRRVLRPV